MAGTGITGHKEKIDKVKRKIFIKERIKPTKKEAFLYQNYYIIKTLRACSRKMNSF